MASNDEVNQWLKAYYADQDAWQLLAGMPYMDWMHVDSDELERLSMYTFSSASAPNADALAGRIILSVTAHQLLQMPLTPRVLSRQYARTATRLGKRLTDVLMGITPYSIRTVTALNKRAYVNSKLMPEMIEMGGLTSVEFAELTIRHAHQAWELSKAKIKNDNETVW